VAEAREQRGTRDADEVHRRALCARKPCKDRRAEQIAHGQLHFAAMLHRLERQKVEVSKDAELRVVLSGHTAFPSLVSGMYQVDPKNGKILHSMSRTAGVAESGAKKVPVAALEKELDMRLQKATADNVLSCENLQQLLFLRLRHVTSVTNHRYLSITT